MIQDIFQVPIFYFDLNDEVLNQNLKKEAYFNKTINNGRIRSNEGGFQSNFIHESKVVDSFFEKIVPCVEEVKKTINYPRKLCLEGLWYNVNKKGDFNKTHCHGNAILAGVYYIETPEDCGDIVFENTDKHVIFFEESDNNNKFYFNGFHKMKAVKGRLYLWYAWLNHYVEPNKSNNDRISLAFNVTPEFFLLNSLQQ
jgi:uncharacterized protein (TIGR02466 family)